VTAVFTVTVTDDQGDTDTQDVTITIDGTNDGPVLETSATPVLAAVDEDAGSPVGRGAVGTQVSSLVDLTPPAGGGLDNVTDADDGAVTGIAITGTNSTNGTWWYSINGGTNWTKIEAVADNNALLLAADGRVYFQGNLNFNGLISDGLTFRAWDQTSGTAGSKVDTTSNGGPTAFSSATDTAAITVTSVDDAPVAIGDKLIVSSSTACTFATSALLGNDYDVDGASLSITAVASASGITGLALSLDGKTITFTSGSTAGTSMGGFDYTVSDGLGGTTTGHVTIDVVSTGTGNDTSIDLSSATYQASYIDYKDGNDTATGGGSGDTFIGGVGNDTLNGSSGDDLLIGGAGNDPLNGGAGNDILRGGTGNDTMDGGAGSEDLIDFSDPAVATTGITFTLVQSGSNTSFNTADFGNDKYLNIEGVIGTKFSDTLTGSSGNDIIRGGGGDDTIDGAGGVDLLDFSDATGAIGTSGTAFTFNQGTNGGGSWSTGALAGLGTDAYKNMEGVIGQGGNDRIVGGLGADTMTGGDGADTFVFDTAPNARDTVTDFQASATDSIELSLATFTALTTASGSTLLAGEFATSNGGGAGDVVGAGVHVIYDSATGNLYYDSDGGTWANRTLFAKLTITDGGTFDNNDIKVGP
jgi:Ca2+-binding RTX toxin-like protein